MIERTVLDYTTSADCGLQELVSHTKLQYMEKVVRAIVDHEWRFQLVLRVRSMSFEPLFHSWGDIYPRVFSDVYAATVVSGVLRSEFADCQDCRNRLPARMNQGMQPNVLRSLNMSQVVQLACACARNVTDGFNHFGGLKSALPRHISY